MSIILLPFLIIAWIVHLFIQVLIFFIALIYVFVLAFPMASVIIAFTLFVIFPIYMAFYVNCLKRRENRSEHGSPKRG